MEILSLVKKIKDAIPTSKENPKALHILMLIIQQLENAKVPAQNEKANTADTIDIKEQVTKILGLELINSLYEVAEELQKNSTPPLTAEERDFLNDLRIFARIAYQSEDATKSGYTVTSTSDEKYFSTSTSNNNQTQKPAPNPIPNPVQVDAKESKTTNSDTKSQDAVRAAIPLPLNFNKNPNPTNVKKPNRVRLPVQQPAVWQKSKTFFINFFKAIIVSVLSEWLPAWLLPAVTPPPRRANAGGPPTSLHGNSDPLQRHSHSNLEEKTRAPATQPKPIPTTPKANTSNTNTYSNSLARNSFIGSPSASYDYDEPEAQAAIFHHHPRT